MLHLADELNVTFSKNPNLWDALAFSSIIMATLAKIKGGPSLSSHISKG
jgi:hypothetical protein